MRSPFQAVLFDMDGTLADTLPDILAVFNPLLVRHGGAALDEKTLVSHFGPTEEEILRKLLPHLAPAQIEAALDEALREAGPIAALPGVAELVRDCKATGYRVGVFTGAGRRFGRSRFERLGIAPAVEAFVAGDEVPTRKPAPEGLLLLCERLGVAPGESVYIGDSPLDVACAKRAGATAVAVSWGVNPREVMAAAGPDHLVDDLAGLRAYLGLGG